MGLFRKKRKKGVIDFTQNPRLPINNPDKLSRYAEGPAASDSSGDSSSALGFLGALASASSESSTSESRKYGYDPTYDSKYNSASLSARSGDFVDKIERLNRRIDRMIERLELIERKIERVENRLDLR